MKRIRVCHKEDCCWWYRNDESKDVIFADCGGKLTGYVDEAWVLKKISELKEKYTGVDARGLGELENLIKR